MKETIVYKTSDGKVFESKNKAFSHQEDLLGEALDSFLPCDDRGNLTRVDRHNILMKQLKDPELGLKLNNLVQLFEVLNAQSDTDYN
jgi:hypothetical protein